MFRSAIIYTLRPRFTEPDKVSLKTTLNRKNNGWCEFTFESSGAPGLFWMHTNVTRPLSKLRTPVRLLTHRFLQRGRLGKQKTPGGSNVRCGFVEQRIDYVREVMDLIDRGYRTVTSFFPLRCYSRSGCTHSSRQA
jgi:hypothetical protein